MIEEIVHKLLDKYNVELDPPELRYLKFAINTYGLYEYYNKILNYLDATKYFPNSDVRIMETENRAYRKYIKYLDIVINELIKEDFSYDELWQRVLDRHNDNLEFEVSHPCTPVKYIRKSATKRTSADKKERKESMAAIKLKEKMAKLNTLSFNIRMK